MFDLPREAGKLKLDLFCRGARVDKNCTLEKDTRPVKRTRGGLGSGLDAILPGHTWVNIPVEEPFVSKSPYQINKRGNTYSLWRETDEICPLILPPKPTWYEETTSSGRKIGEIGVMQGTYFAVYPSDLCGFWQDSPRRNCRFCSVGLCLGNTESSEKSIRDVVEAVKAARRHEKITFVHFNTGYHPRDGALDAIMPFIEAVKGETGLLVGVQCPPAEDLSWYDRLKMAGVDHVSFCFELFDPDRFAEICPGKAEIFGHVAERLNGDVLLHEVRIKAARYLNGHQPHPGQLIFYRALAYCTKLWGKGPVAGEIIAGLESPATSIAAEEFLAELGAVSTVCVFRPCIGTDLADMPSPDSYAIAPVFARQWEVCIEHGIPFGIAPNIRTAMVHLQEESRCLSVRTPELKILVHTAKGSFMKPIFRTICTLRRKI